MRLQGYFCEVDILKWSYPCIILSILQCPYGRAGLYPRVTTPALSATGKKCLRDIGTIHTLHQPRWLCNTTQTHSRELSGLTWPSITDRTLSSQGEYSSFKVCIFYTPDWCGISVRPGVLGQKIRPCIFSGCGAINMCTHACSWMFSDPNTCWLEKQLEEEKGRLQGCRQDR